MTDTGLCIYYTIYHYFRVYSSYLLKKKACYKTAYPVTPAAA